MELDNVLAWVIGVNASLLAVQGLRVPELPRAQLRIQLLTLAVLLLGALLFPAWMGRASAAVWGVLFVAPGFALYTARRRMEALDYAGAARFTRLGWPILGRVQAREAERIQRVLAALEADWDQGLENLERVQRGPPSQSQREARLLYLSYTEQWSELLRTLATDPSFSAVPSSVWMALRAKGRLGQDESLLRTYADHRGTASARRSSASRALVDLVFFEQVGALRAVEALLAGPHVNLHPEAKAAFRAVTLARAGDAGAAAMVDRKLAVESRGRLKVSAQRRLVEPWERFEKSQVDPTLGRQLEEWIEEAIHTPPAPTQRFPAGTASVLAVLALVHLALAFDEGSRAEVLMRWGALVVGFERPFSGPSQAIQLVAANYLHLNLIHLVLNLFGLYLFARPLEAEIGTWRFLLLYGLSGPLVAAAIVILARLGGAEPFIMVGASGAVMAVLGASIVLHARVSWRGAFRGRRELLFGLLIVVGIQTVFDLAHPQVSLGAHLAGVLVGVILALGLIQPAGVERG